MRRGIPRARDIGRKLSRRGRKVLELLEKIQSFPHRKQDAILAPIDHSLNSAAG